MPFRTMETLQAWVAEFEAAHDLGGSAIRVIPQDGEAGADTGLIAMRVANSPTEIYIEPPDSSATQWMVTFEPREEYVRLGSREVRAMAVEVAKLAELCAFLQQKSDEFLAAGR